jgi:hypothetical protein
VICFFCFRAIIGNDLHHRAEWRRTEGEVRVYGEDAPDGPLSAATGPLWRVSHKKCFHAEKKRLELLAAREADPGVQPAEVADWRHQEVVGVEELAGEGHRGDRGAGAAGS